MMMMIMIMLVMSITFMILKHPLSMSSVLIMQTLTIAMITGLLMGTFMMSYIIMIVMISGMLVLFIYMSSVASNEKFKSNIKLIMIPLIATPTGWIIDTYSNTSFNNLIPSEPMITIKMYNSPIMLLTGMLIIYLFVSMVAVSNIVNISKGPLRMKIYE
uniref:NADH dehydrogenase subunit 6 n=1 Tax=Urolabida histrionica TaxID=2880905 RepID=UPI001D0F9FC2|nr:NADH dehydrogenase subunit 6 [Urolabida histrionica]UCC46140.1 NADH dehydrogenase subunit 6 [Urolabida histrionica]